MSLFMEKNLKVAQRFLEQSLLWERSQTESSSTHSTPGGVIRGLLASYQMRAGPSSVYSKPKRATTAAGSPS